MKNLQISEYSLLEAEASQKYQLTKDSNNNRFDPRIDSLLVIVLDGGLYKLSELGWLPNLKAVLPIKTVIKWIKLMKDGNK